MPTKVLHVVHNFPPEITGGTEQYVASLVPLQRAAGLEVEVFCGSEERRPEPSSAMHEFEGIRVHRFYRSKDERYGVLFQPREMAAALLQTIQDVNPDLVHVHHWFNLGHRLVVDLPVPAIASFHDAYVACPRFFMLRPDGGFCGEDLPVPLQRCVDCVAHDDGEPRLRERLEARRGIFAAEVAALRLALAPSQFHAGILAGSGAVPRSLLRVLPLGIPAGRKPPVHRPSRDKLRLVSFGNLSKIKGIDLLLRAVARLPRAQVELSLYGTVLKQDQDELFALAAGLPVLFHGRYTREELWRDARAFDLCVLPSRAYETYSLVAEEAVALQIPLIVSDRGALPERAAGHGFIVPVKDEKPLLDLLRKLMNDPDQLHACRTSMPAQYFTLERHERILRRYYGEVLAGAAR